MINNEFDDISNLDLHFSEITVFPAEVFKYKRLDSS